MSSRWIDPSENDELLAGDGDQTHPVPSQTVGHPWATVVVPRVAEDLIHRGVRCSREEKNGKKWLLLQCYQNGQTFYLCLWQVPYRSWDAVHLKWFPDLSLLKISAHFWVSLIRMQIFVFWAQRWASRPNFLCDPIGIELICYRTRAKWLINDSKTTGERRKTWTGTNVYMAGPGYLTPEPAKLGSFLRYLHQKQQLFDLACLGSCRSKYCCFW